MLSPEDNFENHVEDTLIAGDGLCNRAVVELVVHEAPNQIEKLIEFGTKFDEENGHLALTREGGHSHRRIVHALGDSTGFEMMRATIAYARTRPNIRIWDDTFTIDLLTHDGVCCGAVVSRNGMGKFLIWAKQVILALRRVRDGLPRKPPTPLWRPVMGWPQPTAPGRNFATWSSCSSTQLCCMSQARRGYLVSEAVRGEGAHLRDVNGERFMPAADPRVRENLPPRDVVARKAIFRTMERTQHPNVYLDLSHIDPAMVLHRFPGINRVCKSFGLDITTDRVPVRPGAHYMVGGVTVDMHGRTTVPGLWAAGEVTSSGLHGANRLASNSLIEGLVYGTLCGRGATEAIRKSPQDMIAQPIRSAILSAEPDARLDVADLTASLRSLMVRKMGIVRDRGRLLEAKEDLRFWCRYALSREFDGKPGWELQNLLTVARLMIAAALTRDESRGTHFRSDFPARDDAKWGLRHVASEPFVALHVRFTAIRAWLCLSSGLCRLAFK